MTRQYANIWSCAHTTQQPHLLTPTPTLRPQPNQQTIPLNVASAKSYAIASSRPLAPCQNFVWLQTVSTGPVKAYLIYRSPDTRLFWFG